MRNFLNKCRSFLDALLFCIAYYAGGIYMYFLNRMQKAGFFTYAMLKLNLICFGLILYNLFPTFFSAYIWFAMAGFIFTLFYFIYYFSPRMVWE
jgi:hypothetical protein